MLSKAAAVLLSAFVAAAPASAAVRAVEPLATRAPAHAPAVAPVLAALPITAVVLAPASIPQPVPQPAQDALRAAADPRMEPERAGLRFDGAQERAAGEPPASPSSAEPVAASQLQASLPPLTPPPPGPKKPGFLARLNRASGPASAAEARFNWGAALGVTAVVVLPIALKMEPSASAIISLRLALTALLPIFGALTLFRAGRFLLTKRDPVRRPARTRTLTAALLLGLVVGGGLAAAPKAFERQLTERTLNGWDPASQARGLRGGALREAVLAKLSENSEGREVLDGLRDRLGVLHMPRLYVGRITEASPEYLTTAQYNYELDAIVINASVIEARGWTAERFLAEPALQRIFARENASIFAHELRHAGQSRRALFVREFLAHEVSLETEYEAYITEHYWAVAKLEADPSGPLTVREISNISDPVEVDLDAYLKSLNGSYPKNPHIPSKRYDAWISGVRAGWPAHRAQVFLLLAKRAELKGLDRLAAQYRVQAAALAKTAPPPMR